MNKKLRKNYAILATVITAIVAVFVLTVNFGVGFLMTGQPLLHVQTHVFWIGFGVLLLLCWAYEYWSVPLTTDDAHPITLHTKYRQTFASWIRNPMHGGTPVFDDLNPLPGGYPDFTEDKKKLNEILGKE